MELEGVVKYRLDFHVAELSPPVGFEALNAWRSLLWRLGCIGQDPERYGGLGFGNISLRLGGDGFLITGTQTGHLQHLAFAQYCRVIRAEPSANFLEAEGPIRPSSEALTHAAVFGCSLAVGTVVHGHSPELWRAASRLNLPCIPASVAYGTPDMAAAVERLVEACPGRGVIAMLGHADGVLTYGKNPAEAAWLMIQTLADAIALPDDEG